MSSKFFISKSPEKLRGYPVVDLYEMVSKPGDVGLELEFEGNKFQKDNQKLPACWEYVHDGSLRGDDNAEYKLREPVYFSDVPTCVTDLWKVMDKYGTALDVSNRTSVHVHLNVGKFHLNRLAAFSALYFSVEEILTNWCGEHRVGNLFCMRVKDAPSILQSMKAFIQHGKAWKFNTNLHYSGFNPHAIQKFGSVEIRTMRGASKPEEVTQWVSILERIYNLSAEFPDPRNICDHFSGHGPMAYLEFVLGEHTSTVLNGLTGMTQQDIMTSLYEGIRYAQDLCYCREWQHYVPCEIKRDPFQRKLKKGGIVYQEGIPTPSSFTQWALSTGMTIPTIQEYATTEEGQYVPNEEEF